MPDRALNPSQLFPFRLDDFQYQAIAALDSGKSVVVCAPTGSGKTLIGEYAIHRALATGRRVFYTTPLKALSNQKLRDFRRIFGAENVGLLTGDLSLDRDAPILVMTTEIFRNMLYGTPIGEVGTSIAGVETVVLDECHYMNDPQRGTVWEESIVYCPPSVQLVALSATIANSQQLADWIATVHGPTELVYSDFRPVPLKYYYCNTKGLFPLLDDSGKRVNPRLRPRRSVDPKQKRKDAPATAFVVSQLQQRDMLPAIYFIFSRRGCDRAVSELANVSLLNAEETQRLKAQIDDFLAANPEAGRLGQVEPLYRGIAAHHAGILPAWKGLVEELFQQGLIKVVFATETLAAGINMPARTTVISSLSKRTDRGHRLLAPSEFLQMAGRAGRRGMDTLGHVALVETPFEGLREAVYLATAEADPLESQFTPSYGMVMNLLQTHTLSQAQELIERSFGQYCANFAFAPQQKELLDIAAEIRAIEAIATPSDLELLADYEKQRERLREERRLLKILEHQAEEGRLHTLAAAIPHLPPGAIVGLRSARGAIVPAILLDKIHSSGQFPWLVCLRQDNRWYVASYKEVAMLGDRDANHDGFADLAIPPDLPQRPGHSHPGDDRTLALAATLSSLPLPDPAPEVLGQQERVRQLEATLANHPVEQWAERRQRIDKLRKLDQLHRKHDYLSGVLEAARHRYWHEFLKLVAILRDFDCLDDVTPTDRGKAVAALRGDNELWLALALLSGELDDLAPHHLAAVCAALVTESSRPDSWTHFGLSPTVEATLEGLRGLRREIFRHQRKRNVMVPVWLEYDHVGLIEQWALGMEWLDLCRETSLDEGDIVRMTRRTMDFLLQIPHVPYLPPSLRHSAKEAIELIDRFPVHEIL